MRQSVLAPALFAAVVFLFAAFATQQFVREWSSAYAGLVLFEKTCPLNSG